MKNLFYLVVVALLIGGCSYKNESIALHSYKADYSGPISKERKSVYVNSVQDLRDDKRTIGYVLQDGAKVARLYSETNFAAKYKEGLGYALTIAGFKTNVAMDEASLVIDVYIKDIEIVNNDKNFDKNLQGEIYIEVVVQKGDKTITQNFRQRGGRWIAPSFSSKDLEPFLYTMFSDSINDIVSKLARS